MTRVYVTFIILLITLSSIAQTPVGVMLYSLDEMLLQREYYNDLREKKIIFRKSKLEGTNDINVKYQIYKEIADIYRPYQSDSALHYSCKCLAAAEEIGSTLEIIEARINLSIAFTQTGMYSESENILKGININRLSDYHKSNYYIAQININRYRNISHPSINLEQDFNLLRASYQDSLLKVIDTDTPEYYVTKAERYIDGGEFNKAREILQSALNLLSRSDRAYGYTAYTLAQVYGKVSQTEQQIKYLVQSAISDIICAQRENASLRELALLLYRHKDIQRAHRYIKVALDDAMFSKAKLRSFEVMQILPLIETDYLIIKDRMNRNMKIFGWTLSILVIILFIALWYIFKQKLRQNTLLQENEKINAELNDINIELTNSNNQIRISNAKLNKFSSYQKSYIAHYLKLSSSYIGKIDDYRKMLYKKAMNETKENLLKALKSKELIDLEFQQFYCDFDKSFLDLYPDYVEDFNLLLKPEAQIKLKPDELLNSELRIFALIRLGIIDSAQIANFLGYSVTTIYNYRTKMRNNSLLPRQEFKKAVMNI